MKFLNKKITLFLFIGLVVLVGISQFSLRNICQPDVIGDFCGKSFSLIQQVSFTGALMLTMLLVTLPFHVSVFNAWRVVALVAIPIAIVLPYITAGLPPSMIGPTWADYIALLFYGLYFLVSLIIIAVAALSKKKE